MFLFFPQHSYSLQHYGTLFSLPLPYYGVVAKASSVLAGPCTVMSFWCSDTLHAFSVLDLVLLFRSWRGSREGGEEQELTALPQPLVSSHNLATHLDNPADMKRWEYKPLILKGQPARFPKWYHQK